MSNVNMPWNYRKRPGVRYLQTWHGTPFKRIGLDNPRWSLQQGAVAQQAREYAQWDYLISPNAFCSDLFRRCFAFEGEIIESGYPRNDALVGERARRRRAEVRDALGLRDDQRVVLYAPTWRDTLVDDAGAATFSLALDVGALEEHLGQGHVLLLRMHYLIADAVGRLNGSFMRDVSAYEDIKDLYLAADVLLTDYSSTMVDFAVTGKPIVLFGYDYEEYRDEVRGFYVDLDEEGPSPMLRTSAEVAEALADLEAFSARHDDRYVAFQRRFCHRDDGRASARVVDRVFFEGDK